MREKEPRDRRAGGKEEGERGREQGVGCEREIVDCDCVYSKMGEKLSVGADDEERKWQIPAVCDLTQFTFVYTYKV